MKITLSIVNAKAWLQGIEQDNDLADWAQGGELPTSFELPKPSFYPKAQLRRLSPFSKVVLHCLDLPEALNESLPLIFASRHGDLAQTVELIKGVATGEDLSPTQFTLSVHNATTGLFGIATKNTAETTTISAGEKTFSAGLLEAAMQAQLENTQVIYTYCDFPVPREYEAFEKLQPAHGITLVLSPLLPNDKANKDRPGKDKQARISLDLADMANIDSDNTNSTIESLAFLRAMYLVPEKKLLTCTPLCIELDWCA